MSLNSIQPQLSSLRTCQTDISTGMDIVSEVALDLVEAQATDDGPGLKKLEQMMLECAKLDQEINCYVESVEQMITQVRHEPPDAMFKLKDSVKERFAELTAAMSDAEIESHCKVVAFRDSIRKSLQQGIAHHSCRGQGDSLVLTPFMFCLTRELGHQSALCYCTTADYWCGQR
ncbi:E3 SUMO-protein ligase NSE2 [Silurus asotus]|uniref:E3 SUMO-protein ligase NSE2 n=1 Tax=Silurus asotus TaxID=30991 RepID=A0AAD5ART0_SILAS|nr:E3 SUMO-protein ligase NSE2 [Silurus asotus]